MMKIFKDLNSTIRLSYFILMCTGNGKRKNVRVQLTDVTNVNFTTTVLPTIGS